MMKKSTAALYALVVSLACAMSCAAGLRPIGELHVSSQEVLMSQVRELAERMRFPFLSMMVRGGLEGGEMAKTIGSVDPSSDWGAKLYAEGTNVVAAVFPESARTKPVLVVKCAGASATGAKTSGASAPAWLFVWRDGADLRAIARIASADLATMSQSMMNVQAQ